MADYPLHIGQDIGGIPLDVSGITAAAITDNEIIARLNTGVLIVSGVNGSNKFCGTTENENYTSVTDLDYVFYQLTDGTETTETFFVLPENIGVVSSVDKTAALYTVIVAPANAKTYGYTGGKARREIADYITETGTATVTGRDYSWYYEIKKSGVIDLYTTIDISDFLPPEGSYMGLYIKGPDNIAVRPLAGNVVHTQLTTRVSDPEVVANMTHLSAEAGNWATTHNALFVYVRSDKIGSQAGASLDVHLTGRI